MKKSSLWKNEQKEFGEFLKQKRLKAGLSQSEVAELLGYSSPQFVSNFERGLCAPPLPALRLLVKAYGLSINDLVKRLLKQQQRLIEDALSGVSRQMKVTAKSRAAKSSRQVRLKKAV
jgi:transcriptional regulator with XRE-family HTH domain